MTATPTSAAGPAPLPQLVSPIDLGDGLRLRNRVVMAPMTRLRARPDGTPGELMVHYYAQRASAGLIITEATAVSRQGSGYLGAPALYTDAHAAGWRAVTDAVHAAGGRIALQLFHAGRISHPGFHEGALPVAPSALAAGPADASYDMTHPFVAPRALERAEITGVVEQFRSAARLALGAGFDAVELHAANGYLLDQFLRSAGNHRTDDYGGAAHRRIRLLREVAEAVVSVWGPSRVGVRLSPGGTLHGMGDDNPHETFATAAIALDRIGVGYLHVIEPGAQAGESAPAGHAGRVLGSGWFRAHYSKRLISAGGHTAATGHARLTSGEADLIAYGRPFVANPDLPERLRSGTPLTPHDPSRLYGGGPDGYLDYPAAPRPRA